MIVASVASASRQGRLRQTRLELTVTPPFASWRTWLPGGALMTVPSLHSARILSPGVSSGLFGSSERASARTTIRTARGCEELGGIYRNMSLEASVTAGVLRDVAS
jgi:hypothetical protein